MCGRSRFLAVPEIEVSFAPIRIGDISGVVEEAVPGAVVPGIVAYRGERVVSAFTWAFFDDGTGHNARVESAPQRTAWRDAFAGARLVLPLAAFVEGRAWFHHAGGSPLAVAGLYRRSGRRRRATMLTRPADESVAPMHDRMPVILPPDLVEGWLSGDDVGVARLIGATAPLALVPAHPGTTRQLAFDDLMGG